MNNKYSMDEYVRLINDSLDSYIPDCDFGERIVHDAMKYSLSIGGKRIRPVLVLEFCRLCGGDVKKALPLAVALEMIHTYSLIHDDLPCMDNDDMRRGLPSCHIKFGEEYALLAGDGLLTLAFGIIADSEFAAENPLGAVRAISTLSAHSGVNGMIGGQVVDLMNEERNADFDTLHTMDSLKTGALIRCAAHLGALCGGADVEKIKHAEIYADRVGHAFQIVDDILDVVGDEKLLGKPVGSDKQSGKSTYVTLLGLEESEKYAERLTDEAIGALEIFGSEGEFLKNLALSLVKRQN